MADSDVLEVGGIAYRWEPWCSLRDALPAAFRQAPLRPPPSTPGLYRLRRAGRTALDYIGQTGSGGMTLRKRIRMLASIHGELMPFRDPHTAAPALWALLQQEALEFEVSVIALPGVDDRWRRGLEAVAIATYRQEVNRSPTVNFGRMPALWSMPSSRRHGVLGRHVDAPTANHAAGIAPAGALSGSPAGRAWAGHSWGPWESIEASARAAEQAAGLYRIRSARTGTGDQLLYIGEGLVGARLRAHRRAANAGFSTKGRALAARAPLSASWVTGPWLGNQREELETDLIAAHVLETGTLSDAQFTGS